jgi:hypothetical protein
MLWLVIRPALRSTPPGGQGWNTHFRDASPPDKLRVAIARKRGSRAQNGAKPSLDAGEHDGMSLFYPSGVERLWFGVNMFRPPW